VGLFEKILKHTKRRSQHPFLAGYGITTMIDLHGRNIRSDGLHRNIKSVTLGESAGHLVGKDHAQLGRSIGVW
jgi:hypothetical protein